MSTAAIKHLVPEWVKPSFVIFDIRALLALMAERQSAQMSKITKWPLTQHALVVPIWQQWASKVNALQSDWRTLCYWFDRERRKNVRTFYYCYFALFPSQ